MLLRGITGWGQKGHERKRFVPEETEKWKKRENSNNRSGAVVKVVGVHLLHKGPGGTLL